MSDCMAFGQPVHSPAIRSKLRRGVTLIEVMIGIAITLVILLVMARFFRQMSEEISKGRAVIEMASEGRQVSEMLRRDFANVTVSPRTWTLNSNPNGYFEIIEGPSSDVPTSTAFPTKFDPRIVPPAAAIPWDTTPEYFGDFDDILAMTVRSQDQPYRGRIRTFDTTTSRYSSVQTVETSEVAELVMWTAFADRDSDAQLSHPDQMNLYRRVLLVRPDFNDLAWFQAITVADANELRLFHAFNDISVRWVQTGATAFPKRPIANSLADLAVRENRFGRFLTTFPNALEWGSLAPPAASPPLGISQITLALSDITTGPATTAPLPDVAGAANLLGQDVLLSGVAGFDVRVYSPNAGVNIDGTTGLIATPGDVGWSRIPTPPVVISFEGAFVDLGFSGNAAGGFGWFSETAMQRPYYWAGTNSRVWCSWWPGYESDGIDQDDVFIGTDNTAVDQATDWLDSPTWNTTGTAAVAVNNIVDDQSERETFPPYPNPLRGVQITVRMIEKTTGQIRQFQVESSFVPD